MLKKEEVIEMLNQADLAGVLNILLMGVVPITQRDMIPVMINSLFQFFGNNYIHRAILHKFDIQVLSLLDGRIMYL